MNTPIKDSETKYHFIFLSFVTGSTANNSVSSKPSNKLLVKVPAASNLKSEKSRDTDSDSGISVEISFANTSSTSEASFLPSSVSTEPLTTLEQDKPLPNYCRMVQEAIFALTSGEKNKDVAGCSLLGIFLYLLKTYPDLPENISIMNTKIRSTVALLKRMGLVQSFNDESQDDLIIVNNFSSIENESETPEKSPDLSEKKAKNMSLMKKKAAKTMVKRAKVLQEKKNNGNVAKQKTVIGKENSIKPNYLQNPKKLSPALSAVCLKKKMTRHEAVRAIWVYIKKHKLQDPNQKSVIICDEKLKAVTKKKKVLCNEVLVMITKHMTPI